MKCLPKMAVELTTLYSCIKLLMHECIFVFLWPSKEKKRNDKKIFNYQDENKPPEESPEGETNDPEADGEEPEKTSETADEENMDSAQAIASDDKSAESETQAAEVPSKGSADNVQMEADAEAEQGGANEEEANKEAEGIGECLMLFFINVFCPSIADTLKYDP